MYIGANCLKFGTLDYIAWHPRLYIITACGQSTSSLTVQPTLSKTDNFGTRRNRKYKDGNYPLPPKRTPHATPLGNPEQYLQFSKERDRIFRSVFNDKSYSIFNVTCDTSASYKEMNDIKVPLEDESNSKDKIYKTFTLN